MGEQLPIDVEDLIAELEEAVILLQSRPGNDEVVDQLRRQIQSLKDKVK
jgi:polyhydroxyalkanoate synthesis regulator phasin